MVIISLGPLLPVASNVLPGGSKQRGPRLPSLHELSPDGVYRAALVTKHAVSSYLTLSPLPMTEISGRFAFCGTFPEVTLGGR